MGRVHGPVARSEGLLVEPINDELLVFDQERRVAHSLNEVAARVWRACDGERDLDQLTVECGVDQETVRLTLERLGDVDLLVEGRLTQGSAVPEGVSRRAMLRRSVLAGAGAGLAIPIIRSITAPSIAMAASGRSGNQVKGKAGEHCTSNGQCSPGVSFCQATLHSCQRNFPASCAHTSSCSHAPSFTAICRSGVCRLCASNVQCPASHPKCSAGACI